MLCSTRWTSTVTSLIGIPTTTTTTSPRRCAKVDLKIKKTDGGAHPVAGGPGFQYAISVQNLGPSDAHANATVTDVLPAGIAFVSFDTLPTGVSCVAPAANSRTFTCTIPAELLAVDDPPVAVRVNARVPVGTPAGKHTNKVIVSSTEDPAPCVVTPTDITCRPTNNYDEVTTKTKDKPVPPPPPKPVKPVEPPKQVVKPPEPHKPVQQAAQPAKTLAYTGTDAFRFGVLGAVLVAVGAVLLLVTRRWRRESSLGS
jgi:uncharacterized repeat protein (TIGR01451 family)